MSPQLEAIKVSVLFVCSVMMASFWQGVLLLSLITISVYADMKLDCRPDFVTLVWTESGSQVDLSLFRLGSCFPTSITAREVVFSVDFSDCYFSRLVTGDHLIYANNLTYISTAESRIHSFSHPVVCTYDRFEALNGTYRRCSTVTLALSIMLKGYSWKWPKDWYPLIYQPVFNTHGQGDLIFHAGLMNDDFSGPAVLTSFPLGSFIPIMASVEQATHQPLLLLLEECVAAATPKLHPESNLYTIITNKGCLVDSKISRSKFEPRQKSSEIKLSLQAFRFGLGEQVYLHCKLVAWDPMGLDNTKKACHYVGDQGWELLDNPAYSNLCDCCDSSCGSRKIRSTGLGKLGIAHGAVLGPFTITES